MKKQNGQQAAEMKEQAAKTMNSLKQTMLGTVAELKSDLNSESKSGQELVMTRLEEQRQVVSQAIENQDQRISAIETSQNPIETQEYVAARQFDEGIADLDVQRTVRLCKPRTLQDALVKALEIEAATKATQMRRRVRCVEKYDSVQAKDNSFTTRRRNPIFRQL
nr:unnamed protein product [Callosobruchus chinensis]